MMGIAKLVSVAIAIWVLFALMIGGLVVIGLALNWLM